jgi:general secretion pathway protein A
MENAIAETLFAIEEGEECISVIVGDVGLGKTMSIRIIIDSLDKDRYKIALVTNPSTTFVQMLREIIGQITGKPCEERKKDNLLEIFNRLLFETIDEGKKILIFIDEANVISSAKLENLRLLTNMQDDQRNLFTMVLVGQNELGKRLEHPKRANLFQRIVAYGRIEKIPSEKLVRDYVETRLTRAGGTRKIFTEDAFPHIWENSEHGVPRLINKICKLSLKAGETNELNEINGKIIQQIGERFQKVTRLAIPKRKPRKRQGEKITPRPIKENGIPKRILGAQEYREIEPIMRKEEKLEIPTISKESEYRVENVTKDRIEEKAEPVMANGDELKTTLSVEKNTDVNVESVNVKKEVSETTSAFKDKECNREEITSRPIKENIIPKWVLGVQENSEIEPNMRKEEKAEPVIARGDELKTTLSIGKKDDEKVGSIKVKEETSETSSVFKDNECRIEEILHDRTPKTELATEEDDIEELKIGGSRFWINFPSRLIQQAKQSDHEQCMKLAGTIAAQTLKKNPQLARTLSADPVPVWSEIKSFVLNKFAQKIKR